MNRKLSVLSLLVGSVALIPAGGCSVGSALSQPPYVDFSEFQLGDSRMRISEVIGPAAMSSPQPPDGHLLDFHEFTSGTPGATRLRAVGYIAGDLFTFGLAEIIFWPVELTIAKPREFRAYFGYDLRGNLNGYRVVNDDGSVERQAGIIPR